MWLVSGDIRHLAYDSYDAYGHGEGPELLDRLLLHCMWLNHVKRYVAGSLTSDEPRRCKRDLMPFLSRFDFLD